MLTLFRLQIENAACIILTKIPARYFRNASILINLGLYI